jgi:hypothetical protein
MVCDFKRANPKLTAHQLLRSQWLDQAGGLPRIRALFDKVDVLLGLADKALALQAGAPVDDEEAAG